MTKSLTPAVAVLSLALLTHAALAPAGPPRIDSDGDGILDVHEEILGTDPALAERFQVIVDDGQESEQRRSQPGYDPTKDFLTIEFCHVGEDRYLWRTTLAAEPRPEDSVFHLYVDADADATTGRKEAPTAPNTGTEYMLTVAGGRGSSTVYDAEGNRTSGPAVTYVVDGNKLLVSADVNLARDERGIHYALYVLYHTISEAGQKIPMSDTSPKQEISGVPVSDRKKIRRPGDYKESFQVDATFGHHLLQQVLADAGTVVVPHDRLELDGFVVDDHTTRRWAHLKREAPNAKAWTRPPKPGRYHVGFLMYDDSNDERVGFYLDGRLAGVAVANHDNNRTWLYWLKEAQQFTGDERVELRAVGGNGKHGIANIVFLAKPPEIRTIQYAVENMTSATPVGRPGRVIVSWTTTWPCPTRFEYGPGADDATTVESKATCLVHRVVLTGLDPKTEYHGRAVGTARDGSVYFGDDCAFRAAEPPVPETQARAESVPLTVRNPHTFDVDNWPITTGIPFPQGRLGSAEPVRLLGPEGEVPAQIRVTARWLDGSVKWLLVSFQATAAAEGQAEYRLEFGRDVRRGPAPAGLSVTQDDSGVAVDTGAMRFRIDAHGNLADFQSGAAALIPSGTSCRSQALDENNVPYTTSESDAQIEVEASGPIRAVVKVTSHLTAEDGSRLFRIEKRIEAFRGAAWLRIHHTFVVDRTEKFTGVKELSYRIPVPAAERSWRVALEEGPAVELDALAPGLRQRFHDELVVIDADGGEAPRKARAIGSIVSGGPTGCAVAVRDFWQNYPKEFAIRRGGLDVGLCPPFAAGLYDEFPFEKEGHQLFYYLLDGRYRLKQGVAKTHELLVSFDPPERREPVCAVFQRPLLATAPPEWYCGSKAFYDVAPRDTERFKLYEEAIDKNLAGYVARRERQRDFGMLNYGDWYGERGANWGNIEYDTQHAFFLEHIRSGSAEAFFLGRAAELHNRDVDTVQSGDDPAKIGAVYVHQMCHVGEYYDRSVPGTLGFPRAGFTVSHAWVEGHFDHYFLTGDRRSYETGCAVADFFTRKQLGRPYDFSSTRVPGWHLIMNSAAYAATGDPYYLNASKVVVQSVLELQDRLPFPLPDYQTQGRKPYQIGGWSRMMVSGHCKCDVKHRGNAGFMIAVLLSGLKYYHDVTGDERVKGAIIQGAHYLLEETYSDEVHGFRYTSCPEHNYRPGASPLMVEGIARAYLWTGDDRFRRVLTEAVPRAAGGSSYGKGFSMYYRMAPRVLADLDAAGLTLNQPPGE